VTSSPQSGGPAHISHFKYLIGVPEPFVTQEESRYIKDLAEIGSSMVGMGSEIADG